MTDIDDTFWKSNEKLKSFLPSLTFESAVFIFSLEQSLVSATFSDWQELGCDDTPLGSDVPFWADESQISFDAAEVQPWLVGSVSMMN